MIELMVGIVLMIMAFFGGTISGEEVGRKQMHRGEYSCQTLPDKTIHCWENKENK